MNVRGRKGTPLFFLFFFFLVHENVWGEVKKIRGEEDRWFDRLVILRTWSCVAMGPSLGEFKIFLFSFSFSNIFGRTGRIFFLLKGGGIYSMYIKFKI